MRPVVVVPGAASTAFSGGLRSSSVEQSGCQEKTGAAAFQTLAKQAITASALAVSFSKVERKRVVAVRSEKGVAKDLRGR